MTDDYKCQIFKSHGKGERSFQWEQMSNGEVRATVYCKKCEPMELIAVIANPELFADLLPPKPPTLKPML